MVQEAVQVFIDRGIRPAFVLLVFLFTLVVLEILLFE